MSNLYYSIITILIFNSCLTGTAIEQNEVSRITISDSAYFQLYYEKLYDSLLTDRIDLDTDFKKGLYATLLINKGDLTKGRSLIPRVDEIKFRVYEREGKKPVVWTTYPKEFSQFSLLPFFRYTQKQKDTVFEYSMFFYMVDTVGYYNHPLLLVESFKYLSNRFELEKTVEILQKIERAYPTWYEVYDLEAFLQSSLEDYTRSLELSIFLKEKNYNAETQSVLIPIYKTLINDSSKAPIYQSTLDSLFYKSFNF